MGAVCGMSRLSDPLNPTAMTGFSWKQDKAHFVCNVAGYVIISIKRCLFHC